MTSYGPSITPQTKLRAVAAMAAANYNLSGEPTDSNAAPIGDDGLKAFIPALAWQFFAQF